MGQLTPEQRDVLYLQEAARSGIHTPILAALYQIQHKPSLSDGEMGLGISPANRIKLEQVDRFAGQVQYAASTIRSLTNHLTVSGWKGAELWDIEKGRYTDRFVQAVAAGHTAPASDPTAALLETSNSAALLQAYVDHSAINQTASLDLTQLDQTLLALVDQAPRYYVALSYQRDALLELVRVWRKLDTREAAIASLSVTPNSIAGIDESSLDPALLQCVSRLAAGYADYPHQREALLQMIQRWCQLESRQATIAFVGNGSLAPNLSLLDSALIALLQRIPQQYQGKGDQRNALVESFRLWQALDNRSDTLVALGVNPDIFLAEAPSQTDMVNAATQIDRTLLDFIDRIPLIYQGTDQQRDALIQLTQLWRGIDSPEQTIQSLFNDLKQMEAARRDTLEAPPAPNPLIPPTRPVQGFSEIQMHASIIPNGSFSWAEATSGGLYLPANQAAVDAIVQFAQFVQQVRDRVGRPLRIVNWYHPAPVNGETLFSSHHSIGDAVVFYCDGLTGNQLYWFLDPWWRGGLGRYARFPYLSYIDGRPQRARWVQ